jgi:N-acetylneuraminic acid mutarotase
MAATSTYFDDTAKTTTTTYHFNTDTNEWLTLAPMPEAKCNHSVCVVNDMIFVLVGEYEGSNDDESNVSKSVHVFDPVRNVWSAVAPMSVARTVFAVLVLEGSVYASGGFNSNIVNSMERYCSTSDSWTEVSDVKFLQERYLHKFHTMRLHVDLYDMAA